MKSREAGFIEFLAVISITIVIVVLFLTLGDIDKTRIEAQAEPQHVQSSQQPTGIWAGIVDDLPSGRMVECVFARDESSTGGVAVAVTCDWQNAVVRGRP